MRRLVLQEQVERSPDRGGRLDSGALETLGGRCQPTHGSHDLGAVPEFLAPTIARRHLCGAVIAMSHGWLRPPVRSRYALRGKQGSVTIGMRWMISLNGRG
jgi:hypothetical protein